MTKPAAGIAAASASSVSESWKVAAMSSPAAAAPATTAARASGRRSAAAATVSTEKSAAATFPPLSKEPIRPPAAATIARAGSVIGKRSGAIVQASHGTTAATRQAANATPRRSHSGGLPCPSALQTKATSSRSRTKRALRPWPQRSLSIGTVRVRMLATPPTLRHAALRVIGAGVETRVERPAAISTRVPPGRRRHGAGALLGWTT